MLPAELARSVCVRGGEQEDNATVGHDADAIDIDEEEEDEGNDLQMVEQEETYLEKALRLSKDDKGLAGPAYISDSLDQELQEALKLSAEEATTRSEKESELLVRLCEQADVAVEVAQKALEHPGTPSMPGCLPM